MLFALPLGRLAMLIAGIHGTVRSIGDAAPAVGVRIALDGVERTVTDSAGGYIVHGVAVGAHQLRFTSPAYQGRQVTVFLVDSSDVTLDIDLTPHPVLLPPISVVARAPLASAGGSSGITRDWLESADYRFSTGWQAHQPAGGVDANEAIARLAGVATRGDNATALSVHGGRGSENLTLLDGIPLFGVVHFAGAPSAVNPDAIGTMDVHAGVSSVRFGGALSGVVELETPDVANGSRLTGALSSTEVRSTLRTALGEHGGVLLSARSSFRNLMTDATTFGAVNGYHDLLAVGQAAAGNGVLRVMAFESSNRLRWDPVTETVVVSADVGEMRSRDGDAPAPPSSLNSANWRSTAVGATWTTGGPGGRWRTAAWWSGTSATIATFASQHGERLTSRLGEFGVSTAWTRPFHDGALLVGSDLVRPATNYTTTSFAIAGGSSATRLPATPILAALYAEATWHDAEAVALRIGFRAGTDFRQAPSLDPRVNLSIGAMPGIRIQAGFGRTHQSLQSMLNEENLASTVIGPALLITTSRPAVADQWVLGVEHRFTPGFAIAVGAYARSWRNVLAPAVTSNGFFATAAPAVGDGSARGLDASLSLVHRNLSVNLAGDVARSLQQAGGVSFGSGFTQPWAVSGEIGYRLAAGTELQLRGNAGAGHLATPAVAGFEWHPYQPGTGIGEVEGVIMNLAGPVNAVRLPRPLRLDAGIRHEWRLGNGRIVTAFRVVNLFNRANPIGIASAADGSSLLLRGTPRGIVFEAGWVH